MKYINTCIQPRSLLVYCSLSGTYEYSDQNSEMAKTENEKFPLQMNW
jgi:hypothetical protein